MEIHDARECNVVLDTWGAEVAWHGSHGYIPGGCSYKVFAEGEQGVVQGSDAGQGHFNEQEPGRGRADMVPICKSTGTSLGLPPLPSPYFNLDKGTCCCPSGTEIHDARECNEVLKTWGTSPEVAWHGSHGYIPGGCFYKVFAEGEQGFVQGSDAGQGHFNEQEPGRGRADMVPICKSTGTSLGLPLLPSPYFNLD